MTSTASCYRCLVLLLLPFLILFSVVYFTTAPLTSVTNIPSSDSSSIPTTTTKTTTVETTKARKCIPYTVPDSRPFFDREPPQLNLPRRISNSTRNNLLKRLRSFRLALVACAYNVEKDVDKFREHVEPIIDLFHPTSRIIIIESDSTDNTLAKLLQWPRAQVSTYGNLSKTIPKRTERIAFCRNKLLHKVHQLQPDYMLMLDLDIFAANVSSFLTNFEYEIDDWSVMTANLINIYYDIWALRTLSDTILNYDVWHRLWAMAYTSDYCYNTMHENTIQIHQKFLAPNRNLLEVRSAFDGAGLYKMKAINDCYYSGDYHTCEHVPFHLCMREKNQARIFINPKFTNVVSTDPK